MARRWCFAPSVIRGLSPIDIHVPSGYTVYRWWECKHMKTVTVSVRLPRSDIEQLDSCASESGVGRSTFLKRALQRGAETLMFEQACEAYRRGEVTLSRAAEIAGVGLRDMILGLRGEDVELNYDLGELEKDLRG